MKPWRWNLFFATTILSIFTCVGMNLYDNKKNDVLTECYALGLEQCYSWELPPQAPGEMKHRLAEYEKYSSWNATISIISGLIAFFNLIPWILKKSWYFFLARLREIATAIRGDSDS